MDRLPDELLLQIIEGFSFNELLPVLGTSARWRALGQTCPAFWANIETPKSRGRNEPPARYEPSSEAVKLAVRRIKCTNARTFKLRLLGAYPTILDALAERVEYVRYLDVELGKVEEMDSFIHAMRFVAAPRLRALTIRLLTYSEPCCILPPDFFSGELCQDLSRLCLSNVAPIDGDVLPCFSSVAELRLWPELDLLSAATPDVFAHFPSFRILSLSAPVLDIGSGFNSTQRDIIQVFRRADYSRLQYIELLSDCWDLADETSWPLEQVPHLLADNSECTSFPFLPAVTFQRSHIVFETRDSEDGCIVRFGNEGWSFSRSCTVDPWVNQTDSDSDDADDAVVDPYYDFQLDEPIAGSIQTASLPWEIWSPARFVLDDASNLRMLRIIIGPKQTMPRMGHKQSLRCPNLNTLTLRGDFDSAGTARIAYCDLAAFATAELTDVVLPLSLRLENVELHGEQPETFTKCFIDVQNRDPEAWSYLRTRNIFDRNDDWM
ncbi:hypothetical protein AURDEDRAFT_164553 [Auricularia subglabra TFB-10046 SS5]|nr:hypothetical protein AURDEDRAFT_164553 [Auricularia subglabra TFB-10046 SS5]